MRGTTTHRGKKGERRCWCAARLGGAKGIVILQRSVPLGVSSVDICGEVSLGADLGDWVVNQNRVFQKSRRGGTGRGGDVKGGRLGLLERTRGWGGPGHLLLGRRGWTECCLGGQGYSLIKGEESGGGRGRWGKFSVVGKLAGDTCLLGPREEKEGAVANDGARVTVGEKKMKPLVGEKSGGPGVQKKEHICPRKNDEATLTEQPTATHVPGQRPWKPGHCGGDD